MKIDQIGTEAWKKMIDNCIKDIAKEIDKNQDEEIIKQALGEEIFKLMKLKECEKIKSKLNGNIGE